MSPRSVFGPLLLLAACGGAPEAPPPPPAHAELEAFITAQMQVAGIAGLSAALIVGDQVAWMKSFGYADLDTGRKVDDETPFLLASLSKTFIAMLGEQLEEEGKFRFSDPIDGPLAQSVRHPSHPELPITGLELVTHTSGIIDDFLALGGATTNGDSDQTLREFTQRYAAVPGHFDGAPGQRFDYSNAGVGFLGATLEGAAGASIAELSRRQIFEPIGMTDSGWFLRDMAVEQLAVPYSGTWEEGLKRDEHLGFGFFPATSLRSSIKDLSKYLLTFMRFGLTPEGQRVLPEARARAMREPQVPRQNKDQGIAWYYEDLAGKRWLGHTGSAVGASTIMMFLPEEQRGVIILTNSDLYVRSRLGFPAGRDAFLEIFGRIAAEAVP